MEILVVHGPNLNLLGTREPEVYGHTTLAEIDHELAQAGADRDCVVTSFQSNHEGEIIDRLQEAACAGALLNPGGLTHTSVALRDTVAAVAYPVVEVHLSNVFAREDFRQRSLVSPVCLGVVSGFGPISYVTGLQALVAHLRSDRV